MEAIAPKIFTKEGMKRAADPSWGRVLNLGCGQDYLQNAVNLDINEKSKADVIHDLNIFPYPFEDNSFDLVIARSILEHLSNIPKVMEEIHRILKSGGRVIIQVPYFRSLDAFTDPTHKAFFAYHSLDYFIAGKKLSEYHYSADAKFKLIGIWLGWPGPGRNPIRRFLKKMANTFPDFYEKYISLFMPFKIITYELEAIK